MLVVHGDERYTHAHAIANRVRLITRRTHALGFFYREIEEILRKAERRNELPRNSRALSPTSRTSSPGSLQIA